MTALRLYIDEDAMDRRFVEALRLRDVDVITAGETRTTGFSLGKLNHILSSVETMQSVAFNDKLEQTLIRKLRQLPPDCQQQILDFVEFLWERKTTPIRTGLSLSLQEIAALPVSQRHHLLSSFMAATAEDFANDPSLTEFAILDGDDWGDEDEQP